MVLSSATDNVNMGQSYGNCDCSNKRVDTECENLEYLSIVGTVGIINVGLLMWDTWDYVVCYTVHNKIRMISNTLNTKITSKCISIE